MITVLIKDADEFYQRGLQYFLTDFFNDEFAQQLLFYSDFTVENVSLADITIIAMRHGEYFTCIPELQGRKKGIVIGVVDDLRCMRIASACLQDVIFITRDAPINEIRKVLSSAWKKTLEPDYPEYRNSCFNCQHKTLSLQQTRIMGGLYKGKTVLQIATELNISDKTVFTHKYMMMNKFNLRTDFELFAFLTSLIEKNTFPNLFREHVEN